VYSPAVDPSGPACVAAGDCTGAWAGADCIAGVCYVPKNRYLSVDPSVNAVPVAIQVELKTAPDYPTAVGRTWWVTEPECVDWQGAVVDPPPNPECSGRDYFGWISSLSSDPITRIWTEYPLHVGDCGVVPAVTYEMRTSHDEGATFSDSLELPTAHDPTGDAQSWGDQTGGPVPGMPGIWLPPERATNFGDIQASIRAFERRTDDIGFAPSVWLDLNANRVMNFVDIQLTVLAFEGWAYTWPENNIHPADCP
jgi:hypothetical protein